MIDAQENARQRTVKVKIAAQVQPVLPPPAPGQPFTPVEFDGMTATPYVDAPAARATAAQVRRPPGVLVQGHRGAGSLAGDRPPG